MKPSNLDKDTRSVPDYDLGDSSLEPLNPPIPGTLEYDIALRNLDEIGRDDDGFVEEIIFPNRPVYELVSPRKDGRGWKSKAPISPLTAPTPDKENTHKSDVLQVLATRVNPEAFCPNLCASLQGTGICKLRVPQVSQRAYLNLVCKGQYNSCASYHSLLPHLPLQLPQLPTRGSEDAFSNISFLEELAQTSPLCREQDIADPNRDVPVSLFSTPGYTTFSIKS